MAKKVGHIERKEKHMYYVMGNGDVMEAKMANGNGKKNGKNGKNGNSKNGKKNGKNGKNGNSKKNGKK